MNRDQLIQLLQLVQKRSLSVEDAIEHLSDLPFVEMSYAKLDMHRYLRTGFPEVIFGEGKTFEQIHEIAQKLHDRNHPILITRVAVETGEKLCGSLPYLTLHKVPRCITWTPEKINRGKGYISIITGGTSDIPVAEEAAVTAEIMGNDVQRIYDVGVAGLHRLLAHRATLMNSTVIIAVAGMEGALPSVVAGLVRVPVIGVPTSVGYGASFKGLSALLAMLNSCATGVTIVNIDNGFGAGYTAALINRSDQ